MDELLTQYDVIVVGTGMAESILASALSRIGKSVLHMDFNDYYGENWASFNFDGIQNWKKKNNDSNNKDIDCDVDDEVTYKIKAKQYISNIKEYWYVCPKPKRSEIGGVFLSGSSFTFGNPDFFGRGRMATRTFEKYITRESRKFNLDLSPKLLFSKGPLVELLISSNIGKYAEFKCVSRVLTWRNECLELVPCSRADVFSTKNITVVEKRLLVKILILFSNYPENTDDFKGFENKTFMEYLKYKKLPDNLIHYIVFAMAMGDKDTLCLEGVEASKAFLESLGRYGNTPFIFPMYGSGEIPQCFCRLCAVYGGVYYLKHGVEGIITEGDRCTGIMSEKKRLSADTFIFSSAYFPSELVTSRKDGAEISRGIFITDRSIMKSEKEQLTLLKFPPVPEISKNSVTVIELGPGSNTCPDGYHLVHMTALATSDAAEDLKHVVEALFRKEDPEGEGEEGGDVKSAKPRVLWSLTWNMKPETDLVTNLENVKICSEPDAEFDYDFAIQEAKKIFNEICPGEEFLPRAPDPEELVLETETEERTTEARARPPREKEPI